MSSFALLAMLASAKFNFDRSTVKHALQNTQNDCSGGFLTALECKKFVFGRGSPRSPLGELIQRSPGRPPAGLRGPTSKRID